MCFLLKNYLLVESVYLFIRCNNTTFFQQNTINIDRNDVNKQNRDTKHLAKDNTGRGGEGGGGPTMSLDDFEFLFFDSAGKASKDVETFLNLRFIKKQKPAVFFFFEKIFYANKLKVKNVSLNVPDLL